MDFLRDKSLLHKSKVLVPANELLKANDLVLYYFISMNCQSCRSFDSKLKEVESVAESRGLRLLIIVICLETDKSGMIRGLKKNYPNWCAIPYEDELCGILVRNYGVTHLPMLVVVRENGELVTAQGVKEINSIGINVLITWPE